MLYRIREVDALAWELGRGKHAVQHFSRGSDERVTRKVLLIARLLANEENARRHRPLAHHRLGRALPKGACLASFSGFFQGLMVQVRGHQRGRGGGLSFSHERILRARGRFAQVV